MKSKLSIVDIAHALNISKTSVSFILNGKAKEKRIGDKLAIRVMEYVKDVSYKPNPLAKSLQSGKSKMIGLMVEDISKPFYAAIARLIEDHANEYGYKIIYCSTDDDLIKTQGLIKMLEDSQVDGYIICPPKGLEPNIEALLKQNIPVVLFDRYLPNLKTDYVVVDDKFDAYNATRLLIGNGFTNIAFMTFASGQTKMQNREEGYKLAIKENKLKPHVKEIKFSRDLAVITGAILNYLAMNPHLDAVFAGTDVLGIGCLKAANFLNLNIPEKLAVVTFDDSEVFALYSPPITTICQPTEAIANNVISLLLKKLSGKRKATDQQTIIISTTLKIRNSSVPQPPVHALPVTPTAEIRNAASITVLPRNTMNYRRKSS